MKKHLLLFSVFLLPLGAAAQFPFATVGSTFARAALASKAGKQPVPVAHFQAGNESIPQKRTPAKQVHGAAAEEIKALEGFLEAAQTAYARSEEKSICPNSALAQTLIDQIKKAQSKWDVTPYEQELAFYQQEQQRRQQPAAGSVTP
jgi:hypothetical protein